MGNFLPNKMIAAGVQVTAQWVATGSSFTDSIAYSFDGYKWVGLGKNIFNESGKCVAYGKDNYENNLWVAGGNTSNTLAYSSDGITWTGLENKTFTNSVYDVAYGKDNTGTGLWVAVGAGTGNSMAYSYDGTTWVGLGTSTFGSWNNACLGRNVAFGKDNSGNYMWLACGSSGNGNSLAYSTNGTTWVGLGASLFSFGSGFDVAYGINNLGKNLWIATAQSSGHSIAYSTNGTTWIGLGIEPFNAGGPGGGYVKYGKDNLGNGLWIATGSGGNTLAYSTSGTTWVGINPFSYNNKRVEYGKDNLGIGLWIAGGSIGGNTISYSFNGTTWYGLTQINDGAGIAYANPYFGIITNINAPNFLTTNNDSPVRSDYIWISTSSTGKYILANFSNYNNNNFQMYLSTNFGTNFSLISFFSGKAITASSISSSGQYMIAGQSNSLLYKSSDYGANWTQVTSLTKLWCSLVLSDDGKYCLACEQSPGTSAYISSNFNTSTPTFIPKIIYSSTTYCKLGCDAISSTGQYMIHLNKVLNTTVGIATSSNYGETWTTLDPNNIGINGTNNTDYINVSMTSNASAVYIGVANGIYKSTNLWSVSPSFTKINSPVFFNSGAGFINVSSDGTYLIIVSSEVYYSNNSGETWINSQSSNYASGIMAMSKDGYIALIPTTNSTRLMLSNPFK